MSSETYQNSIIGKGEIQKEGKAHCKDFVQVQIDDPKSAFTLAMDILRQVETQQYGRQRPVSFSLTGSLEPEEG